MARDVVRVVPGPFDLTRYIARQSWVSAYGPPVPAPDVSHLRSEFQRRAISADFGSTAPRLLRRMSSQVDRVIIDIASDRHGVVRVGNGFVSLTPDHLRAFDGQYADVGEVIPFGSAEHFDRFAVAVGRAAEALRAEETLDRAVVLAFPFTDRLDTDARIPRERTDVPALNALYEPYYEVFASSGFPLLRLPDALAVSTMEHEWGPGVDHFVDPAYEWWAQRLV